MQRQVAMDGLREDAISIVEDEDEERGESDEAYELDARSHYAARHGGGRRSREKWRMKP